jgi:tagaturonate epimerase
MKQLIEAIKSGNITTFSSPDVKVYAPSFTQVGNTSLLMVRTAAGKKLIAAGEGELYDQLIGENVDGGKVASLSHENRLILNQFLPYTAPQAFGTQVATMGLGDRLGMQALDIFKRFAAKTFALS